MCFHSQYSYLENFKCSSGATLRCLAGRLWPAGRTLPRPALYPHFGLAAKNVSGHSMNLGKCQKPQLIIARVLLKGFEHSKRCLEFETIQIIRNTLEVWKVGGCVTKCYTSGRCSSKSHLTFTVNVRSVFLLNQIFFSKLFLPPSQCVHTQQVTYGRSLNHAICQKICMCRATAATFWRINFATFNDQNI